jgi:hypothetical protein
MSSLPELGKYHARRLRDIYRSAGWPCQDAVEVDLLAAGMAERVRCANGFETLRVTDTGVALLAATTARNRAAFDSHEALVERVARNMRQAGRLVWRGLSLRAQVPGAEPDGPPVWHVAKPDVFSIRNTSVETYVEPIVHEIKVRRADLLVDLKRPAKRAAYCDMGECWYVLGTDARGRSIGDPSEIPAECGVMLIENDRPVVARQAPRHKRTTLPFGVWMALARAAPWSDPEAGAQSLLGAPGSGEEHDGERVRGGEVALPDDPATRAP